MSRFGGPRPSTGAPPPAAWPAPLVGTFACAFSYWRSNASSFSFSRRFSSFFSCEGEGEEEGEGEGEDEGEGEG